jgi:hypothetical protein
MAPAILPTTLRTEFSCRLCAHKAAVEFADPAAFAEPEPVAGRNRWAQEQALAAAEARLKKRANAALSLVRCPVCHRRDPAMTRRALLPAALPLIGLAPAVFMAGVIATALLLPQATKAAVRLPILVGAALFLCVAPLVILRRRHRMIKEADTSIRFLPPGPSFSG